MATTDSPSPQDTDRLNALTRSQHAWRAFGRRIRSITPSELGRSLLVLGVIGLLLWLIIGSWPALVPFLIGGVFAYIMLPFVNWMDRFMPRALATTISLAIALGIVFYFIVSLVPIVGQEATRLQATIPSVDEIRTQVDEIDDWVATLPGPTQTLVNDMALEVEGRLATNYDQLIGRLVDRTVAGVITLVNTISFILGFVIVPGWVFAVLVDQRRGTEELDKLLPQTIRGDFWAVARILDRTFRAFVQSQIVQAIITGVGVYVGLGLIERLSDVSYQYKILFAIGIGLFQLIPAIGAVLGGAIAFLLALINSVEAAIGVLLVIIAVQLLIRQFVTPRLERRFVNLHPALIVMAIVALSEFGILWILLAAPIIVVIRDLLTYTYGRIGDPARPAGILPNDTAADARRGSLIMTGQIATAPPQQPIPVVYRRGRSARAVQQARSKTNSQNA
ncbi:MAG: AI-2E family transporter [Anaerolineae bacterium]|nr:AI-2E family transporter [Anaerolineae bacterium]MCO5204696.1 AI-2E family transporter [Anaerolineae bacterium]